MFSLNCEYLLVLTRRGNHKLAQGDSNMASPPAPVRNPGQLHLLLLSGQWRLLNEKGENEENFVQTSAWRLSEGYASSHPLSHAK